MSSWCSSGVSANAAKTSRELLVTPPLLVDASLKTCTPAASRTARAPSEKKRLAPSTIIRNLGLSPVKSFFTFSVVTEFGRPPQGTNRSAAAYPVRWNLSRNSAPVRQHEESGRTTSTSSTVTRKPAALRKERENSLTGTRRWANRTSSSRFKPAGSYSTPEPSTMAMVLSLDTRISFDPKSPSGPPVWNLVMAASSSPSSRSSSVTYVCTLAVVIP
mmetsp:Transcript_87162/g.202911  ORF Transcript_87162/g.202911 Transcript_87162/m.202911 type:complete len:217 (-) Transcript_87162:1230-1880(-)